MVPEPEKELRVPPLTLTSPATKLVVASLEVKVSAMVASLVFEPSLTPLVVLAMVIVGAVPSYNQLNWLAAVLVFPTASVNEAPTSMVVAPSPLGVKVAV